MACSFNICVTQGFTVTCVHTLDIAKFLTWVNFNVKKLRLMSKMARSVRAYSSNEVCVTNLRPTE